MVELILSLGSNIGDRKKNLELAISKIKVLVGRHIKSSSIYETEPWGYAGQRAFYNLVAAFHTNLLPPEILERIQTIEKELGRIRQENQYAERTIDIDILFYGSLIVDNKKLTIPHPKIAERKFVLVPLYEISPDFIHPVVGCSIKELLEKCNDQLAVRLYNN